MVELYARTGLLHVVHWVAAAHAKQGVLSVRCLQPLFAPLLMEWLEAALLITFTLLLAKSKYARMLQNISGGLPIDSVIGIQLLGLMLAASSAAPLNSWLAYGSWLPSMAPL